MNWLDVAGPPGVGKSTLCDPIWHHRAIGWDGKLPPAYWRPFLDEMTTLFHLIDKHPSFDAALRMNNRSARKMATVERMAPGDKPYIHTGLVQRGLGFGWRLNQLGADVNLIRRYFWLMPVSLGVVFLEAEQQTIIERNHARRLNPETAHEDRAFMVPLMEEPIRIAREVLRERGVFVARLCVEQSIDQARAQLLSFANREPCVGAQMGSRCQVEVLSAPAWWS